MTKPKLKGMALASTEKREPTAKEAEAVRAAKADRAKRPVRAQYDQIADAEGVMRLQSRHSDEDGHARHVSATFATTSDDFVGASLLHLAQTTVRGGKPSVEALNAGLAFIGAVNPVDEFEAALAVQMAATHELSLDMLARTRTANTREAMRDYGNMATKLSRTFTAQIKALSDWRRGGEQVVRHLHVYEGGQAVVAETVNVGDQGNEKLAFKPHEQGALIPPVSCSNTPRDALPVSGDPRSEPLPLTRRKSTGRGRSKGE